jgi:hypothetical protein
MSKKPHSHSTAALAKRRAEPVADNQAMRERIRLNDGYIKALDTAIGLIDPAFDPGTVPPKRPYTKKFDRGELKPLIIRTLKAAEGGPLSTRAITDQIMERKGMADHCRTEVRRALLHYDVVEKSRRGSRRPHGILGPGGLRRRNQAQRRKERSRRKFAAS